MDITRYRDPAVFLEATGELLTTSVAGNQVLLGVAAMAADQPDVYPEFEGFVALDRGTPVLAATQTPPHNFILSQGSKGDAVRPLCEAIADAGLEVPGILGNRPLADRFARVWADLTGVKPTELLRQGVFSLDRVQDVATAAGQMRDATEGDRETLIDWWEGFVAEAHPEMAAHGSSSAAERVDLRLDPNRGQGLSVWVVGDRLASMSGYSPPVANSVRIGPVYTPPPLRGKGYATALVAAQSRRFLAEGRERCLLHTDLANPTSNAIYQRIGYRKVAEAVEYRFDG
jgi:hypothetical protein